MANIPNEYGVARCLCSGYARLVKFPKCPECGHETDRFYKCDGDIIGCDNCVKEVDAWEETDEES